MGTLDCFSSADENLCRFPLLLAGKLTVFYPGNRHFSAIQRQIET